MAVRAKEKKWLAVLGILVAITSSAVHAACEVQVGRFVSITGSVDVQATGGGAWASAKLETRLCEGDTIRVGERSRAAVSLINDAVLRIDQNTAMRLIDITPQEEESSLLDLFTGAFKSFSRKPKYLKVNTPYLNGSVEGTEFAVRIEENATAITVFEGVVVAANAQGEVSVGPGEEARAAKGQAPQRRTVVRPEEQVQWALYYPPLLAVGDLADRSPALARAANCLANGNTACTFAALDGVPRSTRDANYLLLRATALLAVGRVDEARGDIDNALEQHGQAGAAHALRAVINVAQNRREAALSDGRRAVELDPASAAAKIALSYAQQANLDLGSARDTLLQAVAQSPDDALAWARLSELHLAEGDRKEANAAAARAVALQPGLSRTQNVLGFAALAEIDTAQAQAVFEEAIALDSADPLPRLGLGLARIRQGMLAEGRADLEAAVALDSNNALLRAYLGKAYFEEKRGPLDDQQFRIAKELDPLDPTAYFYNAIRLQTENRPVEALRELEASIERNDNRAVYRSRLLLDQDRAARGTSLARVYNDLGFSQLGINEAARSLRIDPANASAHRFLSDTYRSVGRHETARVSELQQAQMLQDININPIQPSLSDTNLNIVTQGGPAAAGFNEFTPLFERNRVQANVSGIVGGNDTEGAEIVASGVYDRLSLSVGGFWYDTDGFRPNNDLKHELYTVFGQFALTPAVNIQAEYQKRNSDYGDLEMNFDPENYSASLRNTLDTKTTRIGATFTLDERSKIAVLYNHKDVDSTIRGKTSILGDVPSPPFPPGLTTNQLENLATEAKSEQFEGAFFFDGERFNLVAGASHANVDRKDYIDVQLTNVPFFPDPIVIGPPPFPPIVIPLPPVLLDFPIEDVVSQDTTNTRGYIYGDIEVANNVDLTLGLSYDDFDGDTYDLSETNPKLGVTWDATEDLQFRAAYFKILKPVLASNRTLEPTQVAGFNQLFDDVDGTRSTRYGVGADWQPSQTLALGAELTRRELKSVTFSNGDAVFDHRDEWTHRAYGYWAPADRWALSVEAVYDKFENDEDSLVANIVPERVRTVTIPAKATYYHPNGLFGGIGVTYVDQEVDRSPVSTLAQGDSSFTLFDFSVGYRLPKRQGVISLWVQNIFDKDFDYQDNSYREFGDEPSVAPYTPERFIMGRAMFSF